MDSPIVARILRQLLTRPARNCLYPPPRLGSRPSVNLQHRRWYALGQKRGDEDGGSKWQQRMDAFPKDMAKQVREYPKVTADALRNRLHRPKRVKMLARDFLEDSLYNPNYGYFSKHATIFNPGEPFDFAKITDDAEFNNLVTKSYVEFEDALDLEDPNETRQLWHTPTELFRPYYGEAIARYLITNYRLTLFPYHDLIIYEMGAGNGTLMRNILDYIRDTDPDVYRRTRFRIIEISPSLAQLQLQNLKKASSFAQHLDHVEIINRSIFEWDAYIHSPCFFLALEVLDNFAHDSIRYDPVNERPLQGNVLIDEEGEFFEFYGKELDPVAARYLRLREAAARSQFTTPLSNSSFLRRLKHSLPLAPNLTPAEWIPTRMMQFFDILRDYFPAHRLIVADFSSLPETIAGHNAPVVQTRHRRRNVSVTTPYVHQGYFDIFFPTDFKLMQDIYRTITGKLTRILSHKEFLQKWAYLEDTQTQNGENPMLSWYKNARVMTTV